MLLIAFLFSLFLFPQFASAQEPAAGDLLSYEDYIRLVQQQHPLSRQIRLLEARAKQELRKARGGMDPVANAEWDSKRFEETDYFRMFYSYIKVPTLIGLEVDAGYIYNDGVYLNDQNKVPDAGQAFIGLTLPLLQGLWTNERRTLIQQARLLQDRNAAEIQELLNDLLFRAAKGYWQWAESYAQVEIIEEALRLARLRFEATRQSYLQGDKPAIDTLESFINVQNRELSLQLAQLQLQQNGLELATFLWDSEQKPLILSPNAKPNSIFLAKIEGSESQEIEDFIDNIDDSHPALRVIDFDMQSLELERKLKANKLLPKLELKYNVLSTNSFSFFDTPVPFENYKLGVKFYTPLFLRKARADLALADVKIQETRFKRDQKRFELANKIRSYNIETQILQQQIEAQRVVVENYRSLLDAEQLKFRLGESSIFLINSREQSWLNSQQKLVSTIGKYLKAETGLVWAQGQLP